MVNCGIEGDCTIDLTEACNLRCPYCFTHSEHKRKSITLPIAEKIIDYWLGNLQPDKNHISISAWGGEPLLEYPLWKQIIAYAVKAAAEFGRTIEFGGTTNGVLYTVDKVEWLVENQAAMLVSLDGCEEAHKERIFPDGTNSWSVVDRNVRAAKAVFPQQRTRMTLTTDNIPLLYESTLYMIEDIGITNFAFSPAYEGVWSESIIEELKTQLEMILNYMMKRLKDGDPVILKHFNDAALLSTRSISIQNPCGAGNGYTGWSVDGFQWPCHRFNKHGLSFEERAKNPWVIAGPLGKDGAIIPLNQDFRQRFVNFKDNTPKHCLNCYHFGISGCNGGCYAVNNDIGGDMAAQVINQCTYQGILHEFGLRYNKEASEAGLAIPATGWHGSVGDKKKEHSCTCFNACYSEGTQQEITHIDRSTDTTCLCYNTAYNGDPNPRYTTRNILDKRTEALTKVAEAANNLFNTTTE